LNQLAELMNATAPGAMLSCGISQAYAPGVEKLAGEKGVSTRAG
jgi:hypothetical protein